MVLAALASAAAGMTQANMCSAGSIVRSGRASAGVLLLQVKVGDQMPTVELVMATAGGPTPDLFLTTNELFQGQQLVLATHIHVGCCPQEEQALAAHFCS